MNDAQRSTVSAITRRVQAFYGSKMSDGRISCRVAPIPGTRVVQLTCTNNNDLPWYATHRSLVANIGPRGGVAWSAVEGMSNRLVLSSK